MWCIQQASFDIVKSRKPLHACVDDAVLHDSQGSLDWSQTVTLTQVSSAYNICMRYECELSGPFARILNHIQSSNGWSHCLLEHTNLQLVRRHPRHTS